MTEKLAHKRILVCPLDWGLGHAARDVAIIKRLADLGHEVIIAADGGALDLLSAEFPELETLRFRSRVRIRYSIHLPAWLKITLLSPLLMYEVVAEHFRLRRLIRRLRPDVVISDNRYGLWNRRVTSILITHQLSIRLPRFASFLEYPAYQVMKAFISKFDQCWIPDFPGDVNLSGELSHLYSPPRNAVYIGAISRFVAPDQPFSFQAVTPIDLVILLSGPEPQRSQLQKIVLKQALFLEARCVILQGLPGNLKRTDLTPTVSMYNHLSAGELKHLLLATDKIICRAGYTGIMDLFLMKKKTLIIPTPGQTEQEYLAEYLAGKKLFLSCDQDDLDIEASLEELDEFHPDFNLPEEDLLEKVIRKI
ncbi:glycosyltransferase [Bacteroidota bacterium]